MLRLLTIFVVGVLLWSLVVGWALLEGHTRERMAQEDNVPEFLKRVGQYVESEGHGNVALVLIEDGTQTFEVYFGTAASEMLFPLASASKWFTAVGVMKLVEDGKVDLDAPVENYLKRWQLPNSAYDHTKVTVRRLLSHTAGPHRWSRVRRLQAERTFARYCGISKQSTVVIRQTRSNRGRHRTWRRFCVFRRWISHPRITD